MFDIGWTEILIIAVVAIIVVGPKDLPRMLRTLGRYAGQLRRTAGEFRSQFDDAIRDSELDELRSTLQDTSDLNPINQIRDSVMEPLKESADDIKASIEAPQSTADDAEEKPAPKKKSASKSTKPKPKPKPKPKAQTADAKSGGEG